LFLLKKEIGIGDRGLLRRELDQKSDHQTGTKEQESRPEEILSDIVGRPIIPHSMGLFCRPLPENQDARPT
jgi:hypothetical protein